MPSTTQARARFDAMALVNQRQPRTVPQPLDADGKLMRPSELFGCNTFSLSVMEQKLPREVYRKMQTLFEIGGRLDADIADTVAHAVKEWALASGATHFTHWFQPMTGATAEKHDAFLDFDRTGRPIERFSSAMLVQSEPDASSFPSGGIRSTFEARGYTAWDPTSPMFIMESENGKTLCIPSAFISYHGHALDKKTPLLRSMQALNTEAKRMLLHCGVAADRVVASLGCEQEYFLLDRAYWGLRPDLAIGGRTVQGAPSPKGQSLDDHYFGSIRQRVQAYMHEVELELVKLGVPAKTRHNEVAPTQFELAPIFREANVGVDHNQVIQEVLRRVAIRHDFKALLHEKPYAGINGSGKHNNWSLSADGRNLLEPGDTPQKNLPFLATLAAFNLGVYRHAGLLRASIASHGNDFRLGANEAPPAIISVFLGGALTTICDAIASGDRPEQAADVAKLRLGPDQMPRVARDNTDRNRTSPVAFTGNKFEFRAVGSNQSPAWPVTILNALTADGMTQLTDWCVEAGGEAKGMWTAIHRALKESAPVRFEGNNYSDDWRIEAERRGLPNLRKTPEALQQLKTKQTIELFERLGVLTPAELEARYNIEVEIYETSVTIEAELLKNIIEGIAFPVAMAERHALAEQLHSLAALSELGITADSSTERGRFDRMSALVVELQTAATALDAAVEAANAAEDHGATHASAVLPAQHRARAAVDAIEATVTDARWPLPKYREMLFIV